MKLFYSLMPPLFLIGSFLNVPHIAAADEFRVATVDMRKLLKEADVSKGKMLELEAKTKKEEQDLEVQHQALKALEKKLQEKKVATDSKEADEFRAKARDFSRTVKDSDEELKKEFMRTQRDFFTKANKAIEEYAKSNKINLVVDSNEKAAGPILFGDPSLDITAEILGSMNRSSKG